ncbi:hypothetical protein VTK73DRAFT_10352 [Phialemonium thermophilum]|uniref:Uncharacterized protein n=1 Tax=Phialemonium thermophilum TaxID=223376 RepID=A0ABR3XG50_9PEZI
MIGTVCNCDSCILRVPPGFHTPTLTRNRTTHEVLPRFLVHRPFVPPSVFPSFLLLLFFCLLCLHVLSTIFGFYRWTTIDSPVIFLINPLTSREQLQAERDTGIPPLLSR